MPRLPLLLLLVMMIGGPSAGQDPGPLEGLPVDAEGTQRLPVEEEVRVLRRMLARAQARAAIEAAAAEQSRRLAEEAAHQAAEAREEARRLRADHDELDARVGELEAQRDAREEAHRTALREQTREYRQRLESLVKRAGEAWDVREASEALLDEMRRVEEERDAAEARVAEARSRIAAMSREVRDLAKQLQEQAAAAREAQAQREREERASDSTIDLTPLLLPVEAETPDTPEMEPAVE